MKGEIEKNWDEMARVYEDFTEKDDSYSYAIEWPCIQKMLPPLNNKRILDLGCSTGRYSFLFEKENPLSVVGVDISENMLDIAKEKARLRGSKVRFIKADISDPDIFANGKYDFIFSSTTFHYIEDIKSLFLNISNALDDNGVCIVSLMHPVYTAQYPADKNGEFPSDDEWVVRYLDKSKRAYIQPWIEYNDDIENFLSTSYHHTVSDYFNAIIDAGFRIERVEEPYPPEDWKQKYVSRYNAFIETPSYMILRLSK
ncbi:MAG TPA: class I SAM-dependent methyltransferase [Clostridia bacterium]